jgi:predicted kinase
MSVLKTVILMVGLPRSGKTTKALALWRGTGSPIVCPDAIRLALHGQRFASRAEPFVWAIAKIMVRALFLAGHETVIVDATNTTRKRRDEWRDPDWRLEFHEMGTSADDCIWRATAAGDTEILSVIEAQAARYEPVTDAERAAHYTTPPPVA